MGKIAVSKPGAKPMRHVHFIAIALTLSAATTLAAMIAPAAAQAQLPRPSQLPPPGGQAQPAPQQPQGTQQPAPPKPYTPVAITPAAPATDPSFEAFRKQLADVAKRKDRAGLTRLVVAQGFFWQRETGDGADKHKSGIDNLAAAIGLNAKEGFGWDALNEAAQDPTLEPMPERNGVMCAPAGPKFDDKAFEQLIKATGTEDGDWGFPNGPNIEVRGGPQPNAPVVEKLGMHLVWVVPDDAPPATNARPNQPPPAPPALKIVTPSGKVGYVAIDAISPVGVDQICYIKDASGWKIAGFIGGEQ